MYVYIYYIHMYKSNIQKYWEQIHSKLLQLGSEMYGNSQPF